MNFLPSPPRKLSFKKGLLLSIFFVTVVPFSFFLVSGFLIGSDLPGKVGIFPLLIFFATALGLAILLSQKIATPLHKLTQKLEGVYSTTPSKKYTEDELAVLAQYLDKINENLKEKEGDIKRVRNRFVALSAIATAVNQTLDVDQILNEVLETILEVTGFDGGIAFLLDEENKNLTTRAWKGLQLDNVCEFDQIKLGQGIVNQAVKRKQIIFVPDVENNQQLQMREFRDKGIKTILVIPFAAKGRVFGAVALVSFKPKDTSLEENEFLEAIGQQVGMAIDNVGLLSGWTKKAHDLSLLLETSSTFSTSLNLNQILEILTQRMMKILDANFCYTTLMDEERKDLMFETFASTQEGISSIDNPTRGGIEKGKRIRAENLPLHHRVIQTGKMIRIRKGQMTSSEKQLLPLDEKSEIVLMPLSIGKRVLGMVGMGLRVPEKLNSENLNLCKSIISQAAIAFENARLYSEEKKKCVHLALINHVGRKVVSTLNLDKLLESVIEVIQLSFKYDHISLFLLEESSGDLILKTCYGKSCDAVKPGYRLKKGVGMVGRASESGKTILCNDVSVEPNYIPAIGATRSELSVPIKSGKKIMGVLDVENFAEDTFVEQDVAVLETLTDLLATAINNTKLYEETREKAYRLELTHQINRAISSALDLKSIFTVVANELNKVMEYDRINLNFWHPEEFLFKLEMSFCSDAHLSPGNHKNIPADDTNMYDVVQSEKPYYQAKLVLEPDSKPMDRLIFSEGIRSYILLPIIDKQKVIAILSMESKKEYGFGADQMELVELVGSHLSVAIQNARLFSDLQKAYLDLKNTQNHMIQIERFRAVGEMARGVVHDFNNILTSILGRVQMILMKLKKEGMSLSDELRKSLQVIEKSATDGAKILSRIHGFTKAKSDTAFRPTDLNLVVEDSLELTKSYWSADPCGKNKTFPFGTQIEVKEELKAEGKVLGDATELREVLTNLILNAVDAMPKGGALTLKTEEDEESIFLTVEDTGVGMTEEVKSKIFIPFFTTKEDKGTGLGLSLAHGIITRHRGGITTKSSPGSGSSFTIKLPRCDLMEERQTPVKFKGESAHVLVVEDEKNVRELLDEILSTAGHRVTQAKSGEEGIELFRKQKADIVITDLGMSGLSGWDVAEKIKALDPFTPVILSTGWGVKLDQIEEHKQNIDRIISKPFKMEQILNLVSELLTQRKTEGVNA